MRTQLAVVLLVGACRSPALVAPDGGDAGSSSPDAPVTAPAITATVNSTAFVTREHMLAAAEMQISGEPLATAMGRQLTGYSRDALPTDIYFEADGLYWIDLAGFSSGVESYEYSKQPMNGLAFELGAGTPLVFGPVVNPSGLTGSAAVANLGAIALAASRESDAFGTWTFASEPLAWPGFWPTTHVFAQFDPTVDPTSDVELSCVIMSDDTPSDTGGPPLIVGDYECDATTLHLRDRASQVTPTITPGADGFAAWKSALWAMNYLEIMHDSAGNAVAAVDETELANVGASDNTIVGVDATGAPTAIGTYLGSSHIEGFQAMMLLTELDDRAEDWLAHFATTDGTSATGFASRGAALAYNYASPLAWFPSIAVSESADPSGFPRPSYSIASADSELLDLLGIVLGYSDAFALTDLRNKDVGGSQPARAYFDGDPFPADDQLADGEATLHDRALAMLRVALIDLDRMHADPVTGIFVDHVAMPGGARGTTVSTTSVAYAVLALRTASRALGGALELYSNNTPDTANASGPLDPLPLAFPGDASLTFGARIDQMLRAQAALLLASLTDATGRAYSGWDIATGAPVDQSDSLDAHTAAIRGLFAAYLATGDVAYRERALAVFARVQTAFYDPRARIYTSSPAPMADVEYTPLRFALLQSSLRDVYELVAAQPGGESLQPVLEDRIARLDKLVLNGWDDRNGDKQVAWPDECVNVVDGLPRGGLQMAERALTGELGRLKDEGGGGPPTSDREHDCVPEIDDAHLPAALADSITFHVGSP
ncbi:MAG TPA: hypothetical protein VH143_24900 [Kofleriaceae bacterium]|nr:hypothetical protein [Kofleriaceae bacterium]